MPHLILELSDNMVEASEKISKALADCQDLLVKELPTNLTSCKSRFIKYQGYVLGNGDVNNAFVHLTVKVLKGRSSDLLAATSIKLRELLVSHFEDSANKLNLDVTSVFEELNDSYAK